MREENWTSKGVAITEVLQSPRFDCITEELTKVELDVLQLQVQTQRAE